MMDRKIRVARCFLVTGILILGLTLGMTCKKKNQPPGVPSIPSGPTSGRKGDTLRFSTIAEDPDGDNVAVRFDWGDSTMSEWSAWVPSGDSVAMAREWDSAGAFPIRAQAKDTKENASAWSGEHHLAVTLGPNRVPGPPSIPSGPTSGRKGDTLRFSTVAEDPDGDSVAVTDWYMDSHSCTTDSRPGFRYDGKLILTEESRPGQIPYRALLPQGVDNLLVPVCLSATHVAWGAVRLEPVWMETGEVAGVAAALAKKQRTSPAQLDPDLLLRRLVEAGLGGQATGAGVYSWDSAKPAPTGVNPVLAEYLK